MSHNDDEHVFDEHDNPEMAEAERYYRELISKSVEDSQPTIGGNDATVKPVEKLTIGEIRTYADLPVTITHSAPVTRVTVEAKETCRTCRHWDYITDWVQDRADPHDGTCRLITNDARNKAAIYAPACRDKPQLWTEADFACNLWRRRDTE